jgi:hypothetical protein
MNKADISNTVTQQAKFVSFISAHILLRNKTLLPHFLQLLLSFQDFILPFPLVCTPFWDFYSTW